MATSWQVELDGVVLAADCDTVPGAVGCLTTPPDGLGMAELRTEDTTLLGRDGVAMFNDWYAGRIVTLTATVCPTDCRTCGSVRSRVADVLAVWARRCDDAELLIRPPCDNPTSGRADGCDPSDPWSLPYRLVGRPRVAEVEWSTSNVGCADLVLRFDAVDHRLLLADCDGTPLVGSVTLAALTDVTCRDYPRCYDHGPGSDCLTFPTDVSNAPGGPITVTVDGTECVCPTVVFTGPLTDPEVVNVDTGETLGYQGDIPIGQTVTVDGCSCTANEGGADRSWRVTGACPFELPAGDVTLQLSADAGTGTAAVSWRPAVTVG